MAAVQSSGHNFRSPPVFETALAIQFEELASFRAIHFGLFYETVASRFPVVEDQPRTEPIEERFPMRPRQLTLMMMPRKGGPERVWFLDKQDGALLLQLQPDRFGLNWRRTSADQDYQRFGQNGPLFLDEFGKFERFCTEHSLGPIRPNLCEVVYVNHVFPAADETAVECMERVLAGVSLRPDNRLPTLELAAWNRVFLIGDSKGRLYAEAGMGKHPEKGEFVVLKITARVVHREGDEIAAKLQLAHDAVVDCFVAVTTPDARNRRWEENK